MSSAKEAESMAKLLTLATRYYEESAGQVLDTAQASPFQLLAQNQYVGFLALPAPDEPAGEAPAWGLIIWWASRIRGVSPDEALRQMVEEQKQHERAA